MRIAKVSNKFKDSEYINKMHKAVRMVTLRYIIGYINTMIPKYKEWDNLGTHIYPRTTNE